MIILDATDRSLAIVLGAAVATTQPHFVVSYVEFQDAPILYTPHTQTGVTNNTVGVVLLNQPALGRQRQVKMITVFNNDTASATVSVIYVDGANTRTMVEIDVPVEATLQYNDGEGWRLFLSDGSIVITSIPPLEGTWSPVLTFATPGDLTVVYSAQVGSYTKIYNLVRASFTVITSTFTHTTASGFLIFSGLPFAAASVTNNNTHGSCYWQGITKAGYTQITPALGPSDTAFTFVASGSAVAISLVAAADMPTAGAVSISGTLTYQTA